MGEKAMNECGTATMRRLQRGRGGEIGSTRCRGGEKWIDKVAAYGVQAVQSAKENTQEDTQQTQEDTQQTQTAAECGRATEAELHNKQTADNEV
jgi:hypothetical protein